MDMNNFFNDNPFNQANIDFAKLKIRTLANMVTTLHAKFIPHNKQRKLHMKDNFRYPDHSSIISINSGISKYEFSALINILQKIIDNISLYTTENSLIRQDCIQMSAMLKDLNDFITTLE